MANENLIGQESAALEEEDVKEDVKDDVEADEKAEKADEADEQEDKKADDEEDDEPELKIEQPFIPPTPQVEELDYEAERSKLLDERKEVRAALRNGDIDQDEFDEKLDAVNEKLQDLAVRRARVESASQQEAAVAAAQYQWTLAQVKRHIAQSEGIDYDAKENRALLLAWDSKIKALAADDANADKPAEWFLTEAHKSVRSDMEALATRLGFKKDAESKSTVKETLDKRKPDLKKAKSLATLPSAEGTMSGKETDFAHLEGLTGLDLEMALAKMSKEDADAYLSGR